MLEEEKSKAKNAATSQSIGGNACIEAPQIQVHQAPRRILEKKDL